MFVFTVLVILTLQEVTPAKILAIMPMPSYSHQIVANPIWRELSLRGHKVTLLTTDPIQDPSLTNLTQIDLKTAYNLWIGTANKLAETSSNSNFEFIKRITKAIHDVVDHELGNEEVQKLIKNPHAHFDLLMVEYFAPAMFAFQWRFKCPMIGLTTLEAHGIAHENMGNPTHPILYPEFSLPFIPPLTFVQRCISTTFQMFAWFIVPYMIAAEDLLVQKHFGPSYPSVLEIGKNLDLLLINANPVLQEARPIVPSTVYIGGGIHLEIHKDLPIVRIFNKL